MRVALAGSALALGCGFVPGKLGSSDARPGDDATDRRDAAMGDGPATCPSNWYGSAWKARKSITTTGANQTIQEFPLLVSLTADADLVAAQTHRSALVFTAQDGTTRLSHELEEYNAATGRLVAWVRVPQLSSSTRMYLYFDNPVPQTPPDPATTWPASYLAVWHLGEDPTGLAPQIRDSTAAARHLSERGMMQTDQGPGKIAGSLAFDRTNNGLDLAGFTLPAQFTYEAWIYPTNGAGWHCVIENHPSYNRWFGLNNAIVDLWDGTDNPFGAAIMLDTWHHIAASYDGTNLRVYRNGSQIGATVAKTYSAVTSDLQIGYTGGGIGEHFEGRIDEVRVHGAARSPSYFAMAFANQSIPANFYTLGAREQCP